MQPCGQSRQRSRNSTVHHPRCRVGYCFFLLALLWSAKALHGQNNDTGIQLLQSQCLDCHTGPNADGELDLSVFITQRPLVKELDTWRNISQRIALGDMPPADHATLTGKQKESFANWYTNEIYNFDYASVRHPGYEPVRRLTHIEYQNTIRDLFKVDIADVTKFSADLSGRSGFENSANTLFLQTGLFEKYTQSAEHIVGRLFESTASLPLLEAKQKLLAIENTQLDPTERARVIIRRFGDRAFRRPIQPRELDDLLKIFHSAFQENGDFDQAIQKPLIAVLVMPQFLLKVESEMSGIHPQKISDFDLASRLSYFLWATMPDNRLLRLASEGRLSEPEVLSAEVARMLTSKRARALGTVFAAQWLGFDDVGIRRRQDPIDNPWCTETLMEAMRSESALFFYSLLRDNQPVHQLIDARYTYLNEELARHYGIRGIEGTKMRPVRLKTTRRGGILTHASVLSVTAFPDRTSPVVRGHWVLSNLLGTPPPDPPPDVGEIDEQVLERDDLSFREKVQLHSKNPQCAACHQEMDPIGFSLENYDNFGRWRTRQYGEAIDAHGQLPNGQRFTGAAGLREVIASQRRDDLTRQIAKKMLTYATGRQLEYYDEAALRKIVETTRQDDYRFQTLLMAIIESYPFQYKQPYQSASE